MQVCAQVLAAINLELSRRRQATASSTVSSEAVNIDDRTGSSRVELRARRPTARRQVDVLRWREAVLTT